MPKRAFIENAVHALEISDPAKTGVAGVPTRIVSPNLDTVELGSTEFVVTNFSHFTPAVIHDVFI